MYPWQHPGSRTCRTCNVSGYPAGKERRRRILLSITLPVTFAPQADRGYTRKAHDLPGMDGAGRIILHADMDSFFASVEVRERPDLAGLPVVVGADPRGGSGRGVVSTASYEARAFGIHSAMPISTAYRLCPHAVFLRPDFGKYVPASERIMAVLSRYSGDVRQVSIDEAYLDLSHLRDFEEARDLAIAIRDEIREREQLGCSLGIGPGFIVAKIASDFRKPGGLTVVPPGEVRGFLAPLPVRKIPGIGMKSSTLLLELGIRTIADLARVDVQELTSCLGKWGAVLHDLALGNDAEGYRERRGLQSRSIGRETTFEQDTDDPTVLAGALAGLSSAVSEALREEGLAFRTVTVKMRFSGFETRTRSRTLDRPSGDAETIRRLAGEIAGLFPHGRKVRLVGVRLSGISGGASAQKELSEF